MADELALFEAAFRAVATAVVLYLAGSLLAKKQVLDPPFVAKISKLITLMLLPCLYFRAIGGGFSVAYIKSFWILSLAGLLSALAGFLGGEILALLARPSKTFKPWFVLAIAFPNVMAMPLAFVAAICATDYGNSSEALDCVENATTRFFTFTLLASIFLFTVAYAYVQWTLERTAREARTDISGKYHTNGVDGGKAAAVADVVASAASLDSSTPVGCDASEESSESHVVDIDLYIACDKVATENHDGTIQINETEPTSLPYESPRTYASKPSMVRKISTLWAGEAPDVSREVTPRKVGFLTYTCRAALYNPPVLANIGSQIIAYLPSIQQLFFGKGAPLQPFASGVLLLSQATVPLLNLVAGASLVHQMMKLKRIRDIFGGAEVGISRWTMFVLVIGKIIIMPSFFFGIVVVVLDELPYDRWARLSVFIQNISPTAPMIIAVAQSMGKASDAQLIALSIVPQFLLFIPVSVVFVAFALGCTDELKV